MISTEGVLDNLARSLTGVSTGSATIVTISSPRLPIQLLEPVLDDDQLVGRARRHRPDHQETLGVRCHIILWAQQVEGRTEFPSRKKDRRAAERERRLSPYLDGNEVAGRVPVEQFAPAMSPDRLGPS